MYVHLDTSFIAASPRIYAGGLTNKDCTIINFADWSNVSIPWKYFKRPQPYWRNPVKLSLSCWIR